MTRSDDRSASPVVSPPAPHIPCLLPAPRLTPTGGPHREVQEPERRPPSPPKPAGSRCASTFLSCVPGKALLSATVQPPGDLVYERNSGTILNRAFSILLGTLVQKTDDVRECIPPYKDLLLGSTLLSKSSCSCSELSGGAAAGVGSQRTAWGCRESRHLPHQPKATAVSSQWIKKFILNI